MKKNIFYRKRNGSIPILGDVTSLVTDFVENIKQYLDEKSS